MCEPSQYDYKDDETMQERSNVNHVAIFFSFVREGYDR